MLPPCIPKITDYVYTFTKLSCSIAVKFEFLLPRDAYKLVQSLVKIGSVYTVYGNQGKEVFISRRCFFVVCIALLLFPLK